MEARARFARTGGSARGIFQIEVTPGAQISQGPTGRQIVVDQSP